MSAGAVELRPLRRDDLPLVGRWLAEPLVHRWWHQDWSPEALEREFGPNLDGRDPGEVLLAYAGGAPFGLVQRYAIGSYLEYVEELSPVLTLPPGALSLDYLVGEPDRRGQGLGTAAVAAAVAGGWVAYPEAPCVLVPVAAGNVASWRTLERAGFTRVAEVELEPDNPADPRDHVVYRVDRPASSPQSVPGAT